MSTINHKCGPSTIDIFERDYTQLSNGKKCRYHTISGKGKIVDLSVGGILGSLHSVYIQNGITELGSNCFNKKPIISITLPSTLNTINDNCFEESSISSIILPESLQYIGHNNFPATLSGTFNIPSLIKDFPIDNIAKCHLISKITVSEGNQNYTVVDNVLYNKDITIALFCPRTETRRISIPNTVKIIGDYCFASCNKLTGIEIPYSVEEIGKYAFRDVSIKNLVIKNSVKRIEEGAFKGMTATDFFKLSTNITALPNSCFEMASLPNISFIKYIKDFGDKCFDNYKNEIPDYLDFSQVVSIGNYAFRACKGLKYIELSSDIKTIGDYAFSQIDNLNLLFMSFVPAEVGNLSFEGIGVTSTLYVPIGSKKLFNLIYPWNVFANIKEIDIHADINEKDNIGDVSIEKHSHRLYSCLNSLRINSNRDYLNIVLSDLLESYRYLETDKEFEEALALLKFNRMFSHAIVPTAYGIISEFWSTKYKLKFAEYCMLNSIPFEGISMSQEPQVRNIDNILPTIIPQIEIAKIASQPLEDIDIYFDDILRQLQNELSLATESVKIAVSWFTNYALFKQIKGLAENGLDIQLITNNDAINNGGYCLDFNELIKAGGHISLVQYPHMLHHKFCIIDDKTVINGSYNWSRFSETNYENITVIRSNDYVIQSFCQEFKKLLENADLKDITEMPKSVPQRPEYDRYAFKQYITEELDAMAKESSDERMQITALHKASVLNPEYLKLINPEASVKYADAFKLQEQAEYTKKEIVEIAKFTKTVSEDPKSDTQPTGTTAEKSASLSVMSKTKPTDNIEEGIIDKLKASSLFMAVDVSGSMDKTFRDGHVHNIIRKALTAALAITYSKEVSLWTFGTDSCFVANIGLENINRIETVACKKSGTDLSSFVINVSSKMDNNSLVIIFTDDDGNSILKAFGEMKKYRNVFWQIISYEAKCDNIAKTISSLNNASLITLHNYVSKTEQELTYILLKDYISWRQKTNG